VNRAAVKAATKRLKFVSMEMLESAKDDVLMGVERSNFANSTVIL
jgi:ATP-dependent Zn protease